MIALRPRASSRRWRALLVVLVSAALPPGHARAQALALRPQPVAATPRVDAIPDSTPPAYHYATLGLRRPDAIKLGAMSAAALLVSTGDRRGDAWARRSSVQDNGTLDVLSRIGDKTGSTVGTVIGPAIWLLGRARHDSGTAVLGLRTTESVMLGGAAVTVIKLAAGRVRPFASTDHSPTHWRLFGGASDTARSFASGHSTVAAAAAVALAAEWRRQGRAGWKTLGPPTVYALAALTAGSRVRDRQHWLSDVVSGATLGMMSAVVVRRWHDAHPRSWIDRWFLAH